MRNRNQLVIPMDLGIRIDENAPVRKLIEICDELDYTDLDDHTPLGYTD